MSNVRHIRDLRNDQRSSHDFFGNAVWCGAVARTHKMPYAQLETFVHAGILEKIPTDFKVCSDCLDAITTRLMDVKAHVGQFIPPKVPCNCEVYPCPKCKDE